MKRGFLRTVIDKRYVLIGLLLPGGSLVALLAWWWSVLRHDRVEGVSRKSDASRRSCWSRMASWVNEFGKHRHV